MMIFCLLVLSTWGRRMGRKLEALRHGNSGVSPTGSGSGGNTSVAGSRESLDAISTASMDATIGLNASRRRSAWRLGRSASDSGAGPVENSSPIR